MVKKLVSLMMILCLLTAVVSAGAEEDTALLPAEGFDFDFILRLHPEAFPKQIQERMEGYADLLEALRFQGSLLWAKEDDDFDLHLNIIPVTKPDGKIELRFHGPQDFVVIETNLFGEKKVGLGTTSLVDFCAKMAEHLGIPLQYLGLLYPYSWQYSLGHALNDWQSFVEKEENGVISAEAIQELWVYWFYRTYADEPTKILVDALCKNTDAEDAFRAIVAEIPNYFVKDFAQEREIHIRREENRTVWENYKGDVFFEEYSEGENSGQELTLPRMKTGYLPVFSVESSEENGSRSTWVTLGILGREGQPSLVDLKMSMIAFPTVWPADCNSLLSLDLTGTLLPNLGVSCYLEGEKTGRARVEVRKPTVNMEPGEIMLTVEGELIPRSGDVLMDTSLFEQGEEWLDLLTSNEVEIQAFLPALIKPMAQGLIAFLSGIPTSACQTIMDDLTEIGVFTVLSGE